MLDAEIKQQLAEYLNLLEGDIQITIQKGTDEASNEMQMLLDEIAAMSSRIHLEIGELKRTPSFEVNRPNQKSGIAFAGVPLGHEFTSLILALLQVSGRAPKVSEEMVKRIQAIKGPLNFETYVSLSCHNCPDVVQALNTMCVLNPDISHTMIDGSLFQSEVEEREIMGVPAVFLNGSFFAGGRLSLEEILEKLGQIESPDKFNEKEPFDVLVIGGGPAGASASIYAARKGIRTGLIAERFGGQVLDTVGIENLIGTLYTEGSKVGNALNEQVNHYGVDVMDKQAVVQITKSDLFEVQLKNGGTLKSKTLIIATGARWRNTGVPGEETFKNKGVAYCPHCDGPLFKGKSVAVIGGGNSGVEAAIDLAGMVQHVSVLEFMPELKADEVLQNKLRSLPNVTVHTNVATKEIKGQSKVQSLLYTDRVTLEEKEIDLEGVFVQIGLVPNTEWLKETVDLNSLGEIIVDSRGATSIPGIFAAGDCTNSAYKQIIISMGSGATAALGAFDYLIRSK